MSWIAIALIGPVLWSFCNQLDRYFLNRYFADGSLGVLMLFSSLAGALVLPLALFFSDPFAGYGFGQIALLLGTGIAGVYAIYLYLLALQDEEASVVVPFWQLCPVFGYALGWLILGETLSPRQMAASLAIVGGVLVMTWNHEAREGAGGRFKWRLAALMGGSSLILGARAVAFKYVAIQNDFWGSCFWEYGGFTLAGVAIWIASPSSRRAFLDMFNPRQYKDFSRIMSLVVLGEILTLAGHLATNLALLMAPVALVLVVEGLQPVFVFLIGTAATLFFPRFVTESLTKKAIAQKLVCLAAVCAASAWLQ